MTFFAGHTGSIRLRRNTQAVSFNSQVNADDVNTTLQRVGFDGSLENILTGDRLSISTEDPRKLAFFPASTWPAIVNGLPVPGSGEVQESISAYVNVNLYGGLRFFRTFEDAVNNNRANELPLAAFSGAPIPIEINIEDTDFNTAGSVTGFTFQTEREAVEITSLSDKFKQQYSAGLISGSGSIDASFSPYATRRQESSLLLLQLIQRVEIGSSFEAQLFITDENAFGSDLDVYYQFEAVITRAGVEVRSDAIISSSIDFLATGEIKLLVGRSPGYVLQQNQGKILTKLYEVDALLKEIDD
jgi:hypothetical protein